MTLNTMLYDQVYEEDWREVMTVNDFRDDDDQLKEQPALNDTTTPEVQDLTYIQWQIFD